MQVRLRLSSDRQTEILTSLPVGCFAWMAYNDEDYPNLTDPMLWERRSGGIAIVRTQAKSWAKKSHSAMIRRGWAVGNSIVTLDLEESDALRMTIALGGGDIVAERVKALLQEKQNEYDHDTHLAA